ncbi:mechanosensitive ion channel family protein [Zobellia laminariae]|uniref:mechanosensitive ion channel family protein n=1 Tax=Zobellia laminariae TaxID=248906 RepID=UPI0026F43C20|nr:mechanosensitive ion channel domain-containing protein [Zobellia laminariae]WKX77322.1 mechanosensitive ion channel [Zobellia laminariae]
MDKVSEWQNLAFNTLTSIINDIASALPNIIGAIVILLIGWAISKIVRFVLKKVFKIAQLSKLSDKINEAKLFGDSNVKIDIEKVLLQFVKYILLLVFIIVAADIVELTIISQEIANLLRYLPILLSAMVILMIGLYAAKLIKSALKSVFDSMGFGGGKLVSSIVFYVIIIFVTITALNQAGIDTSMFTSNFTLILGAFLLAFALGLGLGSRNVVESLLKTFYARKNYAVGDKVKFADIEGTIEAIDNISVTLNTKEGKLIVPIKEIVENRVKLG